MAFGQVSPSFLGSHRLHLLFLLTPFLFSILLIGIRIPFRSFIADELRFSEEISSNFLDFFEECLRLTY